jgi:thiosulfate/3-mercaptopyruvate sulfurtransferase
VEAGRPAPAAQRFAAAFRPELVADLDRMRAILERRDAQVVDARSRGRFAATEPEIRPGLRGGHIPGSLSLPYNELFRADDDVMLPAEEVGAAFARAGLDPGRPVVASCGSGVSAAVLALGLYRLGRRDAAVYDGSWTEWGGRTDTPVATGAA